MHIRPSLLSRMTKKICRTAAAWLKNTFSCSSNVLEKKSEDSVITLPVNMELRARGTKSKTAQSADRSKGRTITQSSLAMTSLTGYTWETEKVSMFTRRRRWLTRGKKARTK